MRTTTESPEAEKRMSDAKGKKKEVGGAKWPRWRQRGRGKGRCGGEERRRVEIRCAQGTRKERGDAEGKKERNDEEEGKRVDVEAGGKRGDVERGRASNAEGATRRGERGQSQQEKQRSGDEVGEGSGGGKEMARAKRGKEAQGER